MFNVDKSIKKIIGTTVRGTRRDWDGDGVPNQKDCQPRNTMRQDKFQQPSRELGSPKFKRGQEVPLFRDDRRLDILEEILNAKRTTSRKNRKYVFFVGACFLNQKEKRQNSDLNLHRVYIHSLPK